jgi:glycosyltransferase involved in cell wall biosynthesis
MRFSVVIGAYNAETTIEACLASILSAETPPEGFEVIVVDDGSKDKTAELVKADTFAKKGVHLISKENAGKASALNAGLKAAKGDLILVTDADSTVAKDWFIRMGDALSEADMVQGPCYGISVKNIWERIQYAHSLVRLKYSSPKHFFSGANNGFRKTAALDVGGFNEGTLNVTADFISKLRAKGYKVTYSPDMVVYTRYTDSFRGFMEQKLRWREFDLINHTASKDLIIKNVLGFLFSALLLVSFAIAIIGSKQLLLFSPLLAVAVDLLLYRVGIVGMLFSKDRGWLSYFILHSLIIAYTVRLMLVPYLIYRVIRPRKRPTFMSIYHKG